VRARDVVGRRIVGVGQERFYNRNTGRHEVALNWLKLEDGTVISFSAGETECSPFVGADVRPAPGKRGGHACERVFIPAGSSVGRCTECDREWTTAELREETERQRARLKQSLNREAPASAVKDLHGD
jgi:hypothetical protein